jgi:hypothetical protein
VNWTDPQVQIAVVAASAAIFGAVLGSIVGAAGAWVVARMNRDEAREARFATDARRLAAELLRGAEDLAAEVGSQLHWRQRYAGTKQPKATVPVFGPDKDKPLWLMVVEVHLTTRRPATADAAYGLWKATRFLMDEFKAGPKNIDSNGLVHPVGEDTDAAFVEATAKYTKARRRFIDAVRMEFRLPAIWSEEHPDRG